MAGKEEESKALADPDERVQDWDGTASAAEHVTGRSPQGLHSGHWDSYDKACIPASSLQVPALFTHCSDPALVSYVASHTLALFVLNYWESRFIDIHLVTAGCTFTRRKSHILSIIVLFILVAWGRWLWNHASSRRFLNKATVFHVTVKNTKPVSKPSNLKYSWLYAEKELRYLTKR